MSQPIKTSVCPICGRNLPTRLINSHANKCLNEQESSHIKDSNVCIKDNECQIKDSTVITQNSADVSDFDSDVNPKLLDRPLKRRRSDNSSGDEQDRHLSELETLGKHMKTDKQYASPPCTSKKAMFPIFNKVKQARLESNHAHTDGSHTTPVSISHALISTPASLPCETETRRKDAPVGNPDPTKYAGYAFNALDKQPLSEVIRPKCLEDYVGQHHILGKNKIIRTLLDNNKIPSMIFWGPPGCGKTTLAKIIANKCRQSHDTRFTQLSATTAGISDVKEVVKKAKNDAKLLKKRTILFIDEIHRFNKLQQDTFLPHVEDGTICLIGATTENPSFQVNNALLSRCQVITLEKIAVEDVLKILTRALEMLCIHLVPDGESLKNNLNQVLIEENALKELAILCDGDARRALNALQAVVMSKHPGQLVSVFDVQDGIPRSIMQYDRAGEEHYNHASAFQKSIRASDDNAAIYWLARMLEGGEDPNFIARRLLVTASEDIGMADSAALNIAVSTFQACRMLGMPECRIHLAHCTTYLARAPKSRESYDALNKAQAQVANVKGSLPPVPLHIRNAPTKLMKDLGYGKGYQVNSTFLPDSLVGTNFFQPS